jgi:hypothetical protein
LPKNINHLAFGKKFNQEIKIPSQLKSLGAESGCKILNNIPEYIEEIYISFFFDDTYNIPITNLPITIKKIYVNLLDKIGFIEKIPFGCIVMDINNNICYP